MSLRYAVCRQPVKKLNRRDEAPPDRTLGRNPVLARRSHASNYAQSIAVAIIRRLPCSSHECNFELSSLIATHGRAVASFETCRPHLGGTDWAESAPVTSGQRRTIRPLVPDSRLCGRHDCRNLVCRDLQVVRLFLLVFLVS